MRLSPSTSASLVTWVDVRLDPAPALPETVLCYESFLCYDGSPRYTLVASTPNRPYFSFWVRLTGEDIGVIGLRRRLWNKYRYSQVELGYGPRALRFTDAYDDITDDLIERGKKKVHGNEADESDIPPNFLLLCELSDDHMVLYELATPSFHVTQFLMHWIATKGDIVGLGPKDDTQETRAHLVHYHNLAWIDWPPEAPLDYYWRLGCSAEWHPNVEWELSDVTRAREPVQLMPVGLPTYRRFMDAHTSMTMLDRFRKSLKKKQPGRVSMTDKEAKKFEIDLLARLPLLEDYRLEDDALKPPCTLPANQVQFAVLAQCKATLRVSVARPKAILEAEMKKKEKNKKAAKRKRDAEERRDEELAGVKRQRMTTNDKGEVVMKTVIQTTLPFVKVAVKA